MAENADTDPLLHGNTFDWRKYPFSIAIANPTGNDISTLQISLSDALIYKHAIVDGIDMHVAAFDESPQCISAFLYIFFKDAVNKFVHFYRYGTELHRFQINEWAHCYLESIATEDKRAYCQVDCIIRVLDNNKVNGLLVVFPCRRLNMFLSDGTFLDVSSDRVSIVSEIKMLAATKRCNFCPNMRYDNIKISKKFTPDELEEIERRLYCEFGDDQGDDAEYKDFVKNGFNSSRYPKEYTLKFTVDSKEEDALFVRKFHSAFPEWKIHFDIKED